MGRGVPPNDDLISRICAVLGIRRGWGEGIKIARALGVTPGAWTGFKKRGRIPLERLRDVAEASGVGLEYLAYGTEGRPAKVAESSSRAYTREPQDPELRRLLEKVMMVYEKGNVRGLAAIEAVLALVLEAPPPRRGRTRSAK